MKIVIDEHIPYARELFSRFGEVRLLPYFSISSHVLKEADALIVRSVTKVDAKLLSGSAIKFVGTVTSGVDHVDQDYLSDASIVFSSAPGCNAIAVVEYVFSALLCLANRKGFFLVDKVIGIVGMGNIGGCLYHRLKLLGVHTILCDPLLEKKCDVNVNFSSLETLVSASDIITFHVPLVMKGSYPTWHQVDVDFLHAMSNGGILINTSRGSVINNLALFHVLQSGKPLSVVLDVWENEPEPFLPLLECVDIATPHIAGATFEGKVRGVLQVFKAYSAFLGVEQSLDLSQFFHKMIACFKIDEGLNEDMLYYFSNFIYDIYVDDVNLRKSLKTSNSFDILRRSYLHRREWSSLYIKVSDIFIANMFKDFGFSIFDH